MSMARQIYQLQELDLALEAGEQKLAGLQAQLGETAELIQARAELTVGQQQLEELKKHLRTAEYEIKDLESKLKAGSEELYSGRIRNPKELGNLQTELEGLKTKRSQLDDRALAMMDQVEESTVRVEARRRMVMALAEKWQQDQQRLAAEIETTKAAIARQQEERRVSVNSMNQPMLELYLNLRRHKKIAVARVEKGACLGCRISLPVTDLQRVKSGRVIQCSSCGRILYLE